MEDKDDDKRAEELAEERMGPNWRKVVRDAPPPDKAQRAVNFIASEYQRTGRVQHDEDAPREFPAARYSGSESVYTDEQIEDIKRAAKAETLREAHARVAAIAIHRDDTCWDYSEKVLAALRGEQTEEKK